MIEIDLIKLERGTKTEWRTVHRGGKSFRQRFKVGTKEAEPGTSMTKDNLVEMVAAYDSAPGDEITGTLHQGNLHRCTFKDGTQALHKVMDDNAVEGETSYYKMSKILDFDTCPETVGANFGEGTGSCQKWIPDGESALESGVKLEDMKQLAQIFVQDMICCQGDRHSENIIKSKDGKWSAIDNEMWGGEKHFDAWMRSMNALADTGEIETYCPQMSWMNSQYKGCKDDKQEDFATFRMHVIDNIKSALVHEDEIRQFYNDRVKSDNSFIEIRAKNVLSGLEDMKDYVKELQ